MKHNHNDGVGIERQLHDPVADRLVPLEPLDLSRTTWPEYPHPAIVNAITFAARRGLHRYLDRSSAQLRSELGHRHGQGIPGRRSGFAGPP